jgi:hypothetical protein
MSAGDLIGTFADLIESGLTRSPIAALLVALFVLTMLLGWLVKRYIEYKNREGVS